MRFRCPVVKPHTVPEEERWKKNGAYMKKGKPSGNRTSDLTISRSACYLLTTRCFTWLQVRIISIQYRYVRIDNLDILTKIRKEHPPQGDDASTAEAALGRVGRDEQREAHRANTIPNGRPHLELVRSPRKVLRNLQEEHMFIYCWSSCRHLFINRAKAWRVRLTEWWRGAGGGRHAASHAGS